MGISQTILIITWFLVITFVANITALERLPTQLSTHLPWLTNPEQTDEDADKFNRLLYFNISPASPTTPTNMTYLDPSHSFMRSVISGKVNCTTACNGGAWNLQYDNDLISWLVPVRINVTFYEFHHGIFIYNKPARIDATDEGRVVFLFPNETPLPIIGIFSFFGEIIYDINTRPQVYSAIYIHTDLTLEINKRSLIDPTYTQSLQFYQYWAPSLADSALATISTLYIKDDYNYNHFSFLLSGYQSYYTLDLAFINITLHGAAEFTINEDAYDDDGDGDPHTVVCYFNSHPISTVFTEGNTRELLLIIERQVPSMAELMQRTFFENSFIQFDCARLFITINDKLNTAPEASRAGVLIEYSTATTKSASEALPDRPQSYFIPFNTFRATNAVRLYEEIINSRPHAASQQFQLTQSARTGHIFPGNTPPVLMYSSTFTTDGLISCSFTWQYTNVQQMENYFHSAHVEFTGISYLSSNPFDTKLLVHFRPTNRMVTPTYRAPQNTSRTGFSYIVPTTKSQWVPLYSAKSIFRRNILTSVANSFDFDFSLGDYPYVNRTITHPDKQKENVTSSGRADIIVNIPYERGSLTSQPVQCGLSVAKDACSNADKLAFADCVWAHNPLEYAAYKKRHEGVPSYNDMDEKSHIYDDGQGNYVYLSPSLSEEQRERGEIAIRDHSSEFPDNLDILSQQIVNTTSSYTKNITQLREVDIPEDYFSFTKEQHPANAFTILMNPNSFNATNYYLTPYTNKTLEWFQVIVASNNTLSQQDDTNLKSITFSFPLGYVEFMDVPGDDSLCTVWDINRKYTVGDGDDQNVDIQVKVDARRLELNLVLTNAIQWPLSIECRRILFARTPTTFFDCDFTKNCYQPWQSYFTQPNSEVLAFNQAEDEAIDLVISGQFATRNGFETMDAPETFYDYHVSPLSHQNANATKKSRKKTMNYQDQRELFINSQQNSDVNTSYFSQLSESFIDFVTNNILLSGNPTNMIPREENINYIDISQPHFSILSDSNVLSHLNNLVSYYHADKLIWVQNTSLIHHITTHQPQLLHPRMTNDKNMSIQSYGNSDWFSLDQYLIAGNQALMSAQFAFNDVKTLPIRISADFFRLKAQNIKVPALSHTMRTLLIVAGSMFALFILILFVVRFRLLDKISSVIKNRRNLSAAEELAKKKTKPLSAVELDNKYTNEWPFPYFSQVDE